MLEGVWRGTSVQTDQRSGGGWLKFLAGFICAAMRLLWWWRYRRIIRYYTAPWVFSVLLLSHGSFVNRLTTRGLISGTRGFSFVFYVLWFVNKSGFYPNLVVWYYCFLVFGCVFGLLNLLAVLCVILVIRVSQFWLIKIFFHQMQIFYQRCLCMLNFQCTNLVSDFITRNTPIYSLQAFHSSSMVDQIIYQDRGFPFV